MLIDMLNIHFTNLEDQVTRPPEELEAAQADYLVRQIANDCASILDWLAVDIARAHTAKADPRPYYPMGNSMEALEEQFQKNLPGVRGVRPDIFEAIARHQPFVHGKGNLAHLKPIVNEEKHRQFTAKKCLVTENFFGMAIGGASLFRVMPDGSARIGGQPPMGFLDKGQNATDASGHASAAIGTLSEWHFTDSDLHVYWTMRRIAENVCEAHAELITFT